MIVPSAVFIDEGNRERRIMLNESKPALCLDRWLSVYFQLCQSFSVQVSCACCSRFFPASQGGRGYQRRWGQSSPLPRWCTGVCQPVCYFSQKFNKHQMKYSKIGKETLAMLLALQQNEVYVGSTSLPVEVLTNLVFLSHMNNNQNLLRWALITQN